MNEESLFVAALEKSSAAERRAFLDAACGSNPGLRDRLEQLLAADGHDGGILDHGPDTSVLLTAGRAAAPLVSGHPFGDRFRLGRKLGEGGMGEVWVADQTDPVRRQVALKVIRPGLDSDHLLARFDAERQALALMDHPNIARVLDAGTTDDGRPYFVMELVEGVPITHYCDEQRLTPRQRLQLFVPVCQAVQHAHQKGVIHRDLKPSNILVATYDGKPVPKVIDFGVAKATGPHLADHSVSTEVGALVGTLEYMSPEQAEPNSRDIDTRTDVYALGVVLYELLTGGVPFPRRELRAAPFAEMLRLIREVDPPKPSTRLAETRTADGGPQASANMAQRAARVPRLYELDWIVMKCLEKDRARRYESASALAADIRRYLSNEPVQAGPPTARYRVRKFARRHWRALTAASALVAALLIVVATLTVALVTVRQERREKEMALEAEARRRKQARAALDSMTSQVIQDWLTRQPVLLPEHKQFLEGALRHYEEFAADTGQDEESRDGVAQAYIRVGLIRKRLGQRAEAEAAWKRGRDLYAGLSSDFPDAPDHQRALAEALHLLAVLYEDMGHRPEAEDAYRQALALRRQLVADRSDVPDDQHHLAVTLNKFAYLLEITHRPREAEQMHREALGLLTRLADAHTDRPDFRYALAGVYKDLGMLLDRSSGREREGGLDRPGPLRESAAALQQAVAILKALDAQFPNRSDYRDGLARSQNVLGNALRDGGRHADAEQVFLENLVVRRKLAAEFPLVPAYRRGLAITINNLAILYKNMGQVQKAEKTYEEALDILKRLAAGFPGIPDHENEVAGAMVNLARVRLARKDATGARQLLVEAQPHHLAALDAFPDSSHYLRFYRNNRWRLAETELELKDHAAAAAAAGEFLDQGVEPARDAYTAAGLLAGCVRLAARDERLSEAKRQELVAAYGDRALAALRQAIDLGFPDFASLQPDSSLDPLRSRDDFQKLIAERVPKGKP
jgi:serine/threonine protein kinase